MTAICALHDYIMLHNSQEDADFSYIVNEQIPTYAESFISNIENHPPRFEYIFLKNVI